MKIKANKQTKTRNTKTKSTKSLQRKHGVYVVLANISWAQGLPWNVVGICSGTPLVKTRSWNFNFIYEYVCAYAHIGMGTQGTRIRHQIPQSWGYERLCATQQGCRELNLGPLEKEQVLLRC